MVPHPHAHEIKELEYIIISLKSYKQYFLIEN